MLKWVVTMPSLMPLPLLTLPNAMVFPVLVFHKGGVIAIQNLYRIAIRVQPQGEISTISERRLILSPIYDFVFLFVLWISISLV